MGVDLTIFPTCASQMPNNSDTSSSCSSTSSGHKNAAHNFFPSEKKKNEDWKIWPACTVWTFDPIFQQPVRQVLILRGNSLRFEWRSPVTAAKSPTDDVPLPARSYDTLLGLQDRSAVPPLPGLNLTACRRSNAACSFEKQQRSLSKTKMDMLGKTKKTGV